ncbi:segregation/condensation protein A [bacterium]|nr:segregation/condensation protein A [bacterium]
MLHVDVEFYHGPLDLLVALVRQGELDVLELMVGEITRRYIDTCELGTSLDMDDAGSFLVLASVLMEMKSRHLLPHVDETPIEIEAEETREELVRQLLEYRRFREAATLLGERALRQQQRLAREAQDLSAADIHPSKQPIRELELWDLVSAFSRLMRENIVPVAQAIERDPTPLPVYMNRLEAAILQLGEEGVSFRDLLGTTNTRSQIIGKFLATLELIKTRRVWLEMDIVSDEIRFYPPRHEPLQFGESSEEESDAMPMADSSVPPDAMQASSMSVWDEEEQSSEALWASLGQGNQPDSTHADPDNAWADFEPLEDDPPTEQTELPD